MQQIWKTQQWPQDWKGSVFIPIPKKGNVKEWSNYLTIALVSHTSKVMLTSLQARLQQYVNRELPDVQAGFRKCRGTRYQIDIIRWIMEKAREFQKSIYFCFIAYAKALSVWIRINCRKFFKPGFSNIWTVNFQMFKLVLEKAEEPEIKLPTSTGSMKK